MNAKLEPMPVIQMLSVQMYLETTPVNATTGNVLLTIESYIVIISYHVMYY